MKIFLSFLALQVLSFSKDVFKPVTLKVSTSQATILTISIAP